MSAARGDPAPLHSRGRGSAARPRPTVAMIIVAIAVLVAPPALAGCTGHRAQPRASRSAPAGVRDTLLRTAMDGLCAAENKQEMGIERLGQLYDAGPGRYLTVARAESTARQQLRNAMSALSATGLDRTTLGTLVADEDAVLDARARLVRVLAGQPSGGKLALMDGPTEVATAYRDVVDSYVSAGGDFLAAGLASCATPMITVMVGPGQDEASAATVEFRIAAACSTVGYSTRSQRPDVSTPGTASLGTVVQPGTHRARDLYDGSAGPISPPVGAREVVVLTSVHFPVESATCATGGTATPAPAAS